MRSPRGSLVFGAVGASFLFTFLLFAADAIQTLPAGVARAVDVLLEPGKLLGDWLGVPLGHDLLPLAVGSLVFYFVVFLVLFTVPSIWAKTDR